MDMVKNYLGALKKGDIGAIIGLVLLLVLAWFLYQHFTKQEEGMKVYDSSTFDIMGGPALSADDLER